MMGCLMLDVDGVLVTGRPADGSSWGDSLESDLGISQDRLREMSFASHWADIASGKTGLQEVLKVCLAKLQLSVPVDTFTDQWFANDARIEKDVLALVDLLRGRGVDVFPATNQEHLRA